MDNPDCLDTPTVDIVLDGVYNQLVLELGNLLDRPTTACLGRLTFSLIDIKALYTSLYNNAFYTGNILINKAPAAAPEEGLTAQNTAITIATSKAIVSATDEVETR